MALIILRLSAMGLLSAAENTPESAPRGTGREIDAQTKRDIINAFYRSDANTGGVLEIDGLAPVQCAYILRSSCAFEQFHIIALKLDFIEYAIDFAEGVRYCRPISLKALCALSTVNAFQRCLFDYANRNGLIWHANDWREPTHEVAFVGPASRYQQPSRERAYRVILVAPEASDDDWARVKALQCVLPTAKFMDLDGGIATGDMVVAYRAKLA